MKVRKFLGSILFAAGILMVVLSAWNAPDPQYAVVFILGCILWVGGLVIFAAAVWE